MGTDTAPMAEVAGAVRALRSAESDVEIILVGDSDVLEVELAKHTDFSLVAGREVVVCVDNDENGERYGQEVARLAADAGAISIKILRLPGLPEKGDVEDWLGAGGTLGEFHELLNNATAWESKPGRDPNKLILTPLGVEEESTNGVICGLRRERANR